MNRRAIALTAIFAASALITPGEAWPQSDWKVPAEAKTLKNPVKGTGDAKNVIAINCAGCHGASGRGDGVASAALQPKPMDWSSPAVQSDADGELFWKITNGRGPMRTTWHGSICALLLVTLTILVGCASFPSASGAPITDIDQIAGKWAGTINPGHNGFEDPFYLTITPDRKLVAGWGVNTSWGTVTIRNGQATFEMQPPVAEGSIRLYLDGGKRTLLMDGVLPSF